MRIQPLGDSAIILDFSDESSETDELLSRVLSAAKSLERANIPGVIEVTSAYHSVALFLDVKGVAEASGSMPLQDFLTERIHTTLKTARAWRTRGRLIEIPVCYDEEFALDLPGVMQHTSLTRAEVITTHAGAKYTVACIGFMPGFPFLAGLPANLRVPRLTTPRTRVPSGSVAIAIGQAGIYPFESPGGWNVIGRTPLRLFDPKLSPPTLLQPGDRIRFRVITRQRFAALTK